jgi:hypothetical protein
MEQTPDAQSSKIKPAGPVHRRSKPATTARQTKRTADNDDDDGSAVDAPGSAIARKSKRAAETRISIGAQETAPSDHDGESDGNSSDDGGDDDGSRSSASPAQRPGMRGGQRARSYVPGKHALGSMSRIAQVQLRDLSHDGRERGLDYWDQPRGIYPGALQARYTRLHEEDTSEEAVQRRAAIEARRSLDREAFADPLFAFDRDFAVFQNNADRSIVWLTPLKTAVGGSIDVRYYIYPVRTILYCMPLKERAAAWLAAGTADAELAPGMPMHTLMRIGLGRRGNGNTTISMRFRERESAFAGPCSPAQLAALCGMAAASGDTALLQRLAPTVNWGMPTTQVQALDTPAQSHADCLTAIHHDFNGQWRSSLLAWSIQFAARASICAFEMGSKAGQARAAEQQQPQPPPQ